MGKEGRESSFPSPSTLFYFVAVVSFLARLKPKIPFLCLSLLRNQTLVTQAVRGVYSANLGWNIRSLGDAVSIELSMAKLSCEEEPQDVCHNFVETQSGSSVERSLLDLEPISEAEQSSFCVELMKRLNMQRQHSYFCNITLVTKEGNEFKAHRNVLSAASPFFSKLLQSEMKEKEGGVIRSRRFRNRSSQMFWSSSIQEVSR